MSKPIRMCYYPEKGCPYNEGMECYAPLYPDRLTCQMHYENYWDAVQREPITDIATNSVAESTNTGVNPNNQEAVK